MSVQHRNIGIKQRLFALLLLLAVGEWYCGSTLFLHSHYVGDVKVWHSHPFAKAHHSSSQAIYTIAQINHATFTCEHQEVWLAPVCFVIESVAEQFVVKPQLSIQRGSDLRAPPRG
ncbi:MAG: hypothetical protein ACI308_09545 [Muribaculaceae bacterium]